MSRLTRRRVLRAGLASAAALLAVPAAVGADVAADFLPTLEQGAGSAPWGVAIGPDGLIYVTDSRLHQLAAQSPDGGVVRVLASSGSGPGQLRRPQGVAVSPEGEVYVVDGGNRRVQVFDLLGELRRQWGRRGSDPGEFDAPRGIALDAFGDVYVADGFNDRVQKFSRDGEFLLAWGERGRSPGQFSTPTGIAVGASQTIYVADTFRDRVQAFDPDGSFVRVVTEPSVIRNPIGVAVDSADRLYITEDVDHRLVVVESDGTAVGTIGSEGRLDEEFQFPRGVAVDEAGRVYVADSLNHRVQTFRTSLQQFTPPAEAADLAIGVAARAPLTSSTAHNLTNWLVRLDGQLRVAPFAAYFTATGGIDRWGWPISEPVQESAGEVSQYFQRAVMDWTADAQDGRAMFLARCGTSWAADAGARRTWASSRMSYQISLAKWSEPGAIVSQTSPSTVRRSDSSSFSTPTAARPSSARPGPMRGRIPVPRAPYLRTTHRWASFASISRTRCSSLPRTVPSRCACA